MARLINLTGKIIRLANAEGRYIRSLPLEGHALVQSVPTEEYQIDGIDAVIQDRHFRDHLQGLPDPVPDTYYLVNPFIAALCPERSDLLVPAIGSNKEVVRLKSMSGIGVRVFIRPVKKAQGEEK